MTESSNSNQTPSINIRDVTEVVSLIQEKLCQKSPIPSKCSIFRVPEQLRRHNKNVFKPMLVSIGPFHHGKEKLQSMQKIKLWYLHCLLNRAPTRKTTLKCFVEAIGRIAEECRACYEGEIGFAEKNFIEMMVVDGCFIIEFFRKASNEVQRDEEDPVFNMPWMKWRLLNDLNLLENQLPWRALNCLFNLTKSGAEQRSLPNLVRLFLPFEWSPHDNLKHEHILDYIRNSLIGTCTVTPIDARVILHPDQIPSVTELVQTGVRFKVGNYRNYGPLNVTFKDGVMTIPQRFVSEENEYVLRNLIAFEQCDPSNDYKITSYAKLLDDLINTSQDVNFLKHQGILKLNLSSEDVASFFNRIYRDAAIHGVFLYSDLYHEVNAYCRCHRNIWQATLRRDYFNNPWTSLSVMAAITILVFSFLQTLFSILSYYRCTS
ncbi:UPF0481 protein At3g47200-like [Corylus avellana]|uniref:UPF0481 protein At3g47200-like n=1 Tax=Corylus avellana TaxID=13451 RepID=UPI00286CED67|nr:UPF0481 protein At3g47200-like [Corylus avellana]